MSKQIPASERDAIFPFLVQRKNPVTGRWLNVSSQAREFDAQILKQGIESKGYDSRIIEKNCRI